LFSSCGGMGIYSIICSTSKRCRVAKIARFNRLSRELLKI
jgi:hypothetical protein